MSFFKTTLMTAMALVFLATSCKKDNNGGGSGAGEGIIVAKIDGANFKSIQLTTFATYANGVLVVQGNTGDKKAKAIVMSIVGVDGPGTYPIGNNISNTGSYLEVDATDINNPVTKTWFAPYEGNEPGEIKISSLTDTNVKGTFTFKGKNIDGDESVKSITEGSFNVKILM